MSDATPAKAPLGLARAADLHCVVYHVLTVACYAVAFWLWLHPETSGLDTWHEQLVFVGAAAPLLGWISGVDLGVNYHNHTHRPLWKNRFVSRWFARFWTPVAGWPPLWWAYLHVDVHHQHLLQERDWTLPLRRADGSHEPSLRYQFGQWPWRTAKHFWRDLRDRRFDRWRAGKDLLWFLAIYSIPFWLDPWMAVVLWMVPHAFANIMTLNRGMYVQHAGCVVSKDRRFHSNNFLSPYFNRTMFHIGYHGEHHDFPGAHWADLPAIHARAAQKVNAPAPAEAPAAPAAERPSAAS